MSRGEFLAEMMLARTMEEYGIMQTALVLSLGVSRPNLHNLIYGKRGLSADTAHRLNRYFGNSVGS